MDEIKGAGEEEPPTEVQLKTAKEEIQSLTQQLNCLLLLTRKYDIIMI
jgi:hypothetical protein